MRRGLVFGKFMPLHKGHQALVQHALQHCDELLLVLCHCKGEPINGAIRLEWLMQWTRSQPRITVIDFPYEENLLPNTSVSNADVARLWSHAFAEQLPPFCCVFTSEPYGDYIASELGITHICFDLARTLVPVSATLLRKEPFKYWQYLATEAHSYFTGKVAIVGTESTGKSTLARLLAQHFKTIHVPEMARQIVEETEEVQPQQLQAIAHLQAKSIRQHLPLANKLLVSDTELLTTQSYSWFLFNEPLEIEDWIKEANRFDLYLFLQPDCEYIQDGTRLSLARRNALHKFHVREFGNAGAPVVAVHGNWAERLRQSIHIIHSFFPGLAGS